MPGVIGKILNIDLTNSLIWEEDHSKDSVVDYLGSRGTNAKILWEQVKAGIDPLGEESKLVFGAGLLSGTAAPCSGRTTVTCISPLTNLYLKTNVGGQWGGQLKLAGYSTIIVHGKAKEPAYIFIDNDTVEIRNASKYWGMDVREADRSIKKDIGDEDIQLALIGPAGENKVKFASIMFSVYSAAGRGGAGAVMGSKNLKGIAVKGTLAIEVQEPDKFQKLAEEAAKNIMNDSGYEGLSTYGTADILYGVNEMKLLPAYNFKRSSVEDASNITGQSLTHNGYLKRRVSCFSCVISCHRYTTVDSGKYAGTYSGGPEYETIVGCGPGCGIINTEAILKANELINILGMDTISTASVIQWAMECYEKGIINDKDTDGIRLVWGNEDALMEMINKIAYRDGFGNMLAEGVKKASDIVGGESYKWAVHGKGLEQSRIETRLSKGYALSFAVNPRGADHLHTQVAAEFGMGDEARKLVKEITGDENYATPYSIEKKADMVRWHEDCYAVTDCLGFCTFTSSSLYGITPKIMAEAFSYATGIKISEKEIMEAGRRVVTLEKCINVRQGAARKDDKLPYRLMNEMVSERKDDKTAINSQEELDIMLDEYYELHGWDKASSWPTETVLKKLKLDRVAEELKLIDRLGKE